MDVIGFVVLSLLDLDLRKKVSYYDFWFVGLFLLLQMNSLCTLYILALARLANSVISMTSAAKVVQDHPDVYR